MTPDQSASQDQQGGGTVSEGGSGSLDAETARGGADSVPEASGTNRDAHHHAANTADGDADPHQGLSADESEGAVDAPGDQHDGQDHPEEQQ